MNAYAVLNSLLRYRYDRATNIDRFALVYLMLNLHERVRNELGAEIMSIIRYCVFCVCVYICDAAAWSKFSSRKHFLLTIMVLVICT